MSRPGILYRFLKLYVPFGYRMYYHRFRVHHAELVPQHGPLILAINHQNAFMDALAVAIATKRNPWFITRAGVFTHPVARYWLGLLQMLPIYRFRDGHAQMKKNDEAMTAFRQLLDRNEAILIFPEGNHNRNWSLRPLQKGIARLAFGFETENDWNSGLKIVPIGLQYEEHLHSYSDLLVSFGQPIATADYRSIYEQNPAIAINRLLNELSGRMKKLIIHLEPGPDYQIMATKLKQRPSRETDLVQRLISDQKIISEMEAGVFSEMAAKTESKTSHCLLLWPLFASLVLPHLPLLALSKFIVKKTVRDDHWTSSITFSTMILVGPLIYLAEILLVGCLTSGWLWALLFAAWLWPSGRLSLIFRKYCLSENETLVQ